MREERPPATSDLGLFWHVETGFRCGSALRSRLDNPNADVNRYVSFVVISIVRSHTTARRAAVGRVAPRDDITVPQVDAARAVIASLSLSVRRMLY